MKPPNRGCPNRKRPTQTAGAAEPRPKRYRSRDLRIDATPEQLAAVIGAGPPKAAQEWNYLRPKPGQSDSDAPPQRRSKPNLARSEQECE